MLRFIVTFWLKMSRQNKADEMFSGITIVPSLISSSASASLQPYVTPAAVLQSPSRYVRALG